MKKKVLETINSILGMVFITYMCYDFILNMNLETFESFIILISFIFLINYNSLKLIRQKEPDSFFIGLLLIVFEILVFYISITFFSANIIINQDFKSMLIGVAMPTIFFFILFILLLKKITNNALKIVLIVIIYTVFIFTITAICSPISAYEFFEKNCDFTEMFIYSLKYSYTVTELTKYTSVNILRTIQFFACKIVDTISLGLVVSLFSEAIAPHNKNNS